MFPLLEQEERLRHSSQLCARVSCCMFLSGVYLHFTRDDTTLNSSDCEIKHCFSTDGQKKSGIKLEGHGLGRKQGGGRVWCAGLRRKHILSLMYRTCLIRYTSINRYVTKPCRFIKNKCKTRATVAVLTNRFFLDSNANSFHK